MQARPRETPVCVARHVKIKPKQFWGMLKQKGNDVSELSLERFQKFNEEIFFDHTIQPDAFTPLMDAAGNHISKA